MKKFEKYYGIVEVSFRTESLLHVGDGNTAWTPEAKNKKGDTANYSVACVMTNKDGQPFIPGTSFAGVFRSFIGKHDAFFGERQGDRSNIWFGDSTPLSASADFPREGDEIRKRTKVNSATGAGDAENRALFAQSGVSGGAEGAVEIEFWAGTEEAFTDIEDALKSAVHALDDGVIRVGADASNGSGRLRVKDVRYKKYDFTNDASGKLAAYICGTENKAEFDWANTPYAFAHYDLEITGKFNAGFISGSDTRTEAMEDGATKDVQVSVKNKAGKYIIPGSLIKGVLRHQCEKILKTVNAPEYPAEETTRALFGFSDEASGAAARGHVFVDDVVLRDAQESKLRSRTPIDRFVNGVIDGMLMSYEPVNAQEIKIKISFRGGISENDFYRRLLKLACTELASGNLAIGGMGSVGNGYFIGEAREVSQ